ncbi:MAG: YwiC-like family protein [Nitrospiraceae bacterium]|nr:YwiC-like family protein [Nitrospiraceae bacterium]
MRSEVRGYILKEYGSWSVLIISYLLGIGVCRAFAWSLLPLFFALALLINSKQLFMKWTRKTDDRKSFLILLAQIIGAAAILAVIFRSDVPRLLPLLVIPAAYLLSNKLAGEHYLVTELLGFALISLAAVLAKFLLTEGLDVRLFVGVALYFMAGVFKVKVVIFKKTKERIFTALFVFFTVYAYRRFYIPVIVLLPLLDNLLAATVPYKVKLRTIGWIEVAKSILFLVLFVSYY